MSQRAVVSSVRRYEAKATVESGGKKTTITTDLRIEAAGPITLSQLEAVAGQSGYLYVPPTSNLTVLGDAVTIEGRLKLPGRLVKIIARRIEARPRTGSSEEPAIIVDGVELDPDTRDPKVLPKGVTPAGLPPGTKLSKGRKGADATSNQIQPFPPRDSGVTFGTAGWSAADHPTEMNGENGQDGAAGDPGGGILLLCKELALAGSAKKFNLSARGGAGGNGQAGQDGADGGDGGEPFDGRDGVGFASAGFMASVPGGRGGSGGNGGNGGRAGGGGSGGLIIVYTEAPTNALATTAKAGDWGRPGEGGKRGEKGTGGRAASGIKSRFVPGQPKQPDGDDGKPGDRGGNPLRTGADGTIEVKSGAALGQATPWHDERAAIDDDGRSRAGGLSRARARGGCRKARRPCSTSWIGCGDCSSAFRGGIQNSPSPAPRSSRSWMPRAT